MLKNNHDNKVYGNQFYAYYDYFSWALLFNKGCFHMMSTNLSASTY